MHHDGLVQRRVHDRASTLALQSHYTKLIPLRRHPPWHDSTTTSAADISCRFPGRRTFRIASCAPSTIRPWTTAARTSGASTLEVLDGMKHDFQDREPGRHLSRVGHRRVGSGAGEHALARRSRADVRDRSFRDALAKDRRRSWASTSISSRATGAAASIRRRSSRGCARTRRTHQGGAASCTTRHRPASPAAIAEIRKAIDRAGASGAVHGRHRSRRSPRSITGTTSGAST